MIQLALVPECRLPKEGTDCYRLLMAMKRGEYLTVADSLARYGVYALSQRAGDLRRMGWPIRSQMKRLASGKSVAVYSL